MNGADLRGSLLKTLHCLLEEHNNIELQLVKAKKVIIFSMENNESNMQPISLEKDAVWYNYLLQSLHQVKKDISLALSALAQVGVSYSQILSLCGEISNINGENQGLVDLDFSIDREINK